KQTVDARVVASDFVETQPGVDLVGIVASRSWAEKNPNTVAAVQRALIRAIEYMDENPEEALEMAAEFTGAPPELVEAAGVPTWSTDEQQPEDLEYVMGLMERYGVIDGP